MCPVDAGSGLARGTGAPWAFWGHSGSGGCKPFGTGFPSGCSNGFWVGKYTSPTHGTPHRPQALAHQRQPVPNGNEKPSALRPSPAEGRTPRSWPADRVRGIQLQSWLPVPQAERVPRHLPVLPGSWKMELTTSQRGNACIDRPPNISRTSAPSSFTQPVQVPEKPRVGVSMLHVRSHTCCLSHVFALVSLLGG